MKQRGRRGEAAKEVEELASDYIEVSDPPEKLLPAEREVWLAAVQSMPPGWFKAEHRGALTALCRHTCYADVLAGLIAMQDQSAPEGRAELCKLMAAHAKETSAINLHLRSMRLTHQSRYDEKHAFVASNNNVPGDRLPWENH